MAADTGDGSAFLEELYVARCKDAQEQPSREEFLRFSSRLKARTSGHICSLRNQHLGVSAANTLSKFLRNRTHVVKLDLYCNLIRDHGLQVLSHLMHLNPSIRVLNVGCNDLSDKAASCMGEVVESGRIRSLQLGSVDRSLHPNKLTGASLGGLFEAASKSQGLEALGINGSSFQGKAGTNVIPPEAGLVKLLSMSATLRTVTMRSCQMGTDAGFLAFTNGLGFNAMIRRLDVSDNALTTREGVRLAQYLTEPVRKLVPTQDPDGEPDSVLTDDYPKLFWLSAEDNKFGPQVAIALGKSLETYDRLGFLALSGNPIGDDGAIALAKILVSNETIVDLRLAGCAITATGGVALVTAIEQNQVLRSFDLSKNKLGDRTASAFAQALLSNENLQSVKLASALLTDAGGVQIAQASQNCASLTSIDMRDNFFTEAAGSAMERLFRDNPYILKVDVSGTQINHFAFHALNEICERNLQMLRAQQARPLRNQLLKAQFSIVELKRKEAILEQLVAQRTALQGEIDQMDEQVTILRNEEEMATNMLTKQIQEKELQMKNDRTDFEDKLKKLSDELKELETKKAEVSAALDAQLFQIKETRAKTEERKAVLAKMTEEFEAAKAARQKEIDEINTAADALLKLATDAEALAQMEELPEFLPFAQIQAEAPVEAPVEVVPAKKGRKGKKGGKKKK